MKNWIFYASPAFRGQGYGLICGECADLHGEGEDREFITIATPEPVLFKQNCDLCGKNAGDYYHHKEAA